jgi:hypothetical protein
MSPEWKIVFFSLAIICFLIDVLRERGVLFKPGGGHALMSLGFSLFIVPFLVDAIKAA